MATKIKLIPATIYKINSKTYVNTDVCIRESHVSHIKHCKQQRSVKIKVRPLWP